jgi:hypothetical protein
MKNFSHHTIPFFRSWLFMCTATLSTTLTADFSYQKSPNSLITTLVPSKPVQKSISAEDAALLQQELLKKTQELERYKATLFRASHPSDEAKILELTQSILQLEKAKQDLMNLIKEHEKELVSAKEQINNLEVSSNALTSFIQTQRATIEAKKQELATKIRAYEDNNELTEARQANEILAAELEVVRTAVASYENQIKELERAHGQELHDALQDAAMLKFELADLRLSTQQKEHEVMVSTLHDLSVAFDQVRALKSRHQTHQEELNESQQNISVLKNALETSQRDKEHIIFQHDVEKHVLEATIIEHNESVSNALISHQLAIHDYVAELLTNSEEKTDEFEQAIQALTAIAEHQDHALAEANHAFSRVQELNLNLELENLELKERLHQQETAERLRKIDSRKENSKEKAESHVPTPALIPLLKPRLNPENWR